MSIIRLGNLWHSSNMYLKHTSAALSTFCQNGFYIHNSWLTWGWVGDLCVCCVQQILQTLLIAVFMGVAHISLQILPSSNKWAYNTITILSYTTPTIPPSQWHLMPSPLYHHHQTIIYHHHYTTITVTSYTIIYHDTITYCHCFLQIWPFSLPSAALGEFPCRCYSSHTLALPTAAACPALRDFTIATNGKLYGDCQFSFIGDGLLKVNFTGNKVNITQISPCNVLDTFDNAMYLI